MRLVLKDSRVTGTFVEVHSGKGLPILFQRLDVNLITKGLKRRNIEIPAEFVIEDSRFNPPQVTVVPLSAAFSLRCGMT